VHEIIADLEEYLNLFASHRAVLADKINFSLYDDAMRCLKGSQVFFMGSIAELFSIFSRKRSEDDFSMFSNEFSDYERLPYPRCCFLYTEDVPYPYNPARISKVKMATITEELPGGILKVFCFNAKRPGERAGQDCPG